jgi:hypothetical protein
MHYSGNMFRLAIESSSGPYIKYVLQVFIKIKIFSYWILMKIHGNPSRGSSVFPCRRTDDQTDGVMVRQTDRHGEANCGFPKNHICNRVKNRGSNIHWPPDLFPEIVTFSPVDAAFHPTYPCSHVTCQHLHHDILYECLERSNIAIISCRSSTSCCLT